METQARGREVRRVLIITLAANLLVAAAKIIIGLITYSLAMVSDGVHSLLDATSNVLGLVSSWFASRPPDETHPYGHRRFETLAAMFIGGLLLLTAWEIVKSAVARLAQNITPEITALNFIVMLATIVVNVTVSAYEARMGRQLKSELLLADSEHTRSDIYVSLTVLASLAAVQIGFGWIDAVATFVVVALIARAAWKILSHSADVLVDRAPLEPASVREVVKDVPGIRQVMQVRSRGAVGDIHVDLDVQVSAPTTADQSAAIAREIRERLRRDFDGLEDIRIYFVPTRDPKPDVAQVARAEGDALGLGVHEVIPVQDVSGGLRIDMHVEVPPEQTVAEAHEHVSLLEERLMQSIPELTRIVTHIEPAHLPEHTHYDGNETHTLARQVLDQARSLYPEADWHDLDIRQEADGGFAISMHTTVSPTLSIEEAHRLAERVETAIRADLPQVHRVTIHTEPTEE